MRNGWSRVLSDQPAEKQRFEEKAKADTTGNEKPVCVQWLPVVPFKITRTVTLAATVQRRVFGPRFWFFGLSRRWESDAIMPPCSWFVGLIQQSESAKELSLRMTTLFVIFVSFHVYLLNETTVADQQDISILILYCIHLKAERGMNGCALGNSDCLVAQR
jgi:hypothetical protein